MKDKTQFARNLIWKIAMELWGAVGFFFLGCLLLDLIYYAHDCSYTDRIDRVSNWSTFLLLGMMASGLFLVIRWKNENPRNLLFLSRISDRHGWYMKSLGGGGFFIFTWPVASVLLLLPLLYRRVIHLHILREFVNRKEYAAGQTADPPKEATY